MRTESHFLLVNKPAGLFSQAATGVTSLKEQLVGQLRTSEQHRGTPFVGLPHRLDRETSGIMLIARNQRALKRFGGQFQSRKIGKFYLGVVSRKNGGQPPENVFGDNTLGDRESECWDDWLRKIPDQAKAELVERGSEGARLAQLEVGQIASEGDLSLLLIHLMTGRMHQIRVQAASRGKPVLGDRKYGSMSTFGEVVGDTDQDQAHGRIALHALRIEFRHPQTGLMQSGTAPVPEYWGNLPAKLADSTLEISERSRSDPLCCWSIRHILAG